ncbi:MAG: response regulator [Lachnospiraceae bacterium]|nr:response regulator [Lachnospiraceae bacterium]
MGSVLIYCMIYLGSALMVYNIVQYIRFSRHIRERGNWEREINILNFPILLLVLFLCGYLAIAIFGNPDLIVAGILLGGSIFVAVILILIRRIASRIQENEQLESRLLATEKASEAKSFFLSNMSHDIRTPLNAILGYTMLAQKEGQTQEEQLRYLHKIDVAGHQLLALVNDVLEMSRIESGKMELEPECINIETSVRETAELMNEQMEVKNIKYEVCCDVKRTCVLCDGSHLDRVILNLLGNACKFTPDGGEVILFLKQTENNAESGRYEIRVKDNGIGMSEEFAKNVFQPFERERTSSVSKTQGTGLGMAITKKIIDLMEGDIRLITEKGKGSEFIVTLKLPYASEQQAQTSCGCPFENNKNLRLLLAEDNSINREIAALILTDLGFEVDTAEDGDKAVKMLLSREPGYYRCILMDIQMPLMDGYEATGTIRALSDEKLSGIPIIAMTANAFKEDVDAAMEAGMQGHIAKPIDINVLKKTLGEVLFGENAEKMSDNSDNS